MCNFYHEHWLQELKESDSISSCKCLYDGMIIDDYFYDSSQKYLAKMRAFQPEKHALQLNLF